jgi:hypothetical protein
VTADHERIEELLAGYALRSLDAEDAALADRLLAEHVPSCPSCRRAASELQEIAGELALAAGSLAPPDLLLPRIHRATERAAGSRGSPHRSPLLVLTAGLVALAALGGLSVSLGTRASEAEAQRGTALEILSVMRSPGTTPVGLDPQAGTPAGTGFVEVSAPDVRRLYLASDACPDPAPGHAYQVWLGSDGTFVPVGEMFRPDGGVVLLELVVDVSRHDEVWITEEVAGTRPSSPRTDGGHSWRAALP